MKWLLISLVALLPLACASPTEPGPEPVYLTFINGLQGYDIVELYFVMAS
jgi:hypothetical protein